jgi:hypothetical protein
MPRRSPCGTAPHPDKRQPNYARVAIASDPDPERPLKVESGMAASERPRANSRRWLNGGHMARSAAAELLNVAYRG